MASSITTTDEFTMEELARFAEVTTGKIESNLQTLYDLAEVTGDELTLTRVHNIMNHALELKTTAHNAIDTTAGIEAFAQEVMSQRDQVIHELQVLNTALEKYDSCHPQVGKLIDDLSDEQWQQWLDDKEDDLRDKVQFKLNHMMILPSQVKQGKHVDVTQLVIDAVTGQFHLDDQSDDLLRQLVLSLIEHEAIS